MVPPSFAFFYCCFLIMAQQNECLIQKLKLLIAKRGKKNGLKLIVESALFQISVKKLIKILQKAQKCKQNLSFQRKKRILLLFYLNCCCLACKKSRNNFKRKK
jgi:hypothetical protein